MTLVTRREGPRPLARRPETDWRPALVRPVRCATSLLCTRRSEPQIPLLTPSAASPAPPAWPPHHLRPPATSQPRPDADDRAAISPGDQGVRTDGAGRVPRAGGERRAARRGGASLALLPSPPRLLARPGVAAVLSPLRGGAAAVVTRRALRSAGEPATHASLPPGRTSTWKTRPSRL